MSDLASLKRETTICTYRGKCYIVATPFLLRDIAGNKFAGTQHREPGVIIRNYIADNAITVIVNLSTVDANTLKAHTFCYK